MHPGDEVVALPSGRRTRVRSINTWDGDLTQAHAPQSVVLTLEDEIDISRGEMIASAADAPRRTRHFEATVSGCTRSRFDRELRISLNTPARPFVRGSLRYVLASCRAFEHHPAEQLGLNDIGQVVIETSRPLLADLYRDSRATGSLILIRRCRQHHRGRGNDSQYRGRAESDAAINRATRGLLVVGNRAQLATQPNKVCFKPQFLSFARALLCRPCSQRSLARRPGDGGKR